MLSEQETIIIINEKSLKQGYFELGTSLERIYTRVLKRIGGKENLISERLSTCQGNVTWWQLRIPKRFLSRTYSIKPIRPKMRRENSIQEHLKKKSDTVVCPD